MLSATLASEQDQAQTQLAVATAIAKGTEQLLNILDTLEQSLSLKQKELSALSPIQVKKRKDLESEIIDTERQIQSVKNRLSDLQAAYKPDNPAHTPDSESVEQRRKRIQSLKEIQSQIYKEFYTLVEENKDNMKQLRDLIRGKRDTYDTHTEQKLKEHFKDNFQKSILMKAREQAPELPEIDGHGMRNTKTYRH